MRDPKAESEFLDFAPTKRAPGPSTIQKIGPSTLGAWMDSNERASAEKHDEPCTGWKLVLAWVVAWTVSAGVLALTVTGLYSLIVALAGV